MIGYFSYLLDASGLQKNLLYHLKGNEKLCKIYEGELKTNNF